LRLSNFVYRIEKTTVATQWFFYPCGCIMPPDSSDMPSATKDNFL